MANHYVLESASGAATGADWTNAYVTLPGTLVRGDTYYMGSGSYSSYAFDDASSGTTTITIQRATITNHGTDTGWLDSYATGLATFTGKLNFSTGYWVLDGVTGGGPRNNWNLNFGFKVIETGDHVECIEVGGTGEGNVTIQHIEIEGKGSVSSPGGFKNDGLIVYGSTPNVTLSYYWMHGIGRAPFVLFGNNLINEYGWVESYFGDASTHSEIGSLGISGGIPGNMTFRYNLFTDVESTGGLIWNNAGTPASVLSVYGNIFYRPAAATWSNSNGCIGGLTGGGGEECRNVKVYNNTFINVNIQTLSDFPLVFSGNVAYNNLWYTCNSPLFTIFGTHDYDHFIVSGGTHSESNGTSNEGGDPFVNYVALDFHLTSNTNPGIDLGSPYNVDMYGTTRTSWTRGALEFVEATAPSPVVIGRQLRWL